MMPLVYTVKKAFQILLFLGVFARRKHSSLEVGIKYKIFIHLLYFENCIRDISHKIITKFQKTVQETPIKHDES